MGTLLISVLALAVVAAAALIVRAVLALRGTRVVTCPETRSPAAVELDLKHALPGSLIGRPGFRLADCTRWPERAHCGQACLDELEAAPHDCLVRVMLARWYEGRACAYCRRTFGEVHWLDHRPALVGPDGRLREWRDIPPAEVPHALRTHRPVCWNCAVAEGFRREHPELVTERTGLPSAFSRRAS